MLTVKAKDRRPTGEKPVKAKVTGGRVIFRDVDAPSDFGIGNPLAGTGTRVTRLRKGSGEGVGTGQTGPRGHCHSKYTVPVYAMK